MSEQSIPVVNLEHYTQGDESQKQAFIKALGDGLRELGFVAVEGHGVSKDLIDRNYAAFKALFGLDEDTKKKYERPEHGRQRGYTSFGVEHAKGTAKADLKEFWHVGRELESDHPLSERMPPNEWPDELPQLKEEALNYYQTLDEVGRQLLEALGIYLGQEPDQLPSMARDGNSVMRIIHYPVCDGFSDPGAMRAAAHEDINLITLLPQATESGLEIMTREGEWLGINAIPGQLIVDTGDMMKRITNDQIPATRHRVVNPQGEPTERYSMPFFVHPHPDCMLDVLPGLLEDGEQRKYPAMTADEYLLERLSENKVK